MLEICSQTAPFLPCLIFMGSQFPSAKLSKFKTKRPFLVWLMKGRETRNNNNKWTHLRKVIQQDSTWVQHRNIGLWKMMKTCNLFPDFTGFGAEGKSGGYCLLTYSWNYLYKKIRSFGWIPDGLHYEERTLYTYQQPALIKNCNENSWTFCPFLRPVAHIKLRKLLFWIQSRHQISKCRVHNFVYRILVCTEVHTGQRFLVMFCFLRRNLENLKLIKKRKQKMLCYFVLQ